MNARLFALVLLSATAMSAHAFTTCHGTTLADPAQVLMPCGDKPNCVSTEHADPERRITVPTAVTLPRLREAIAAEPRSDIVAEGNNWLIAHFRSRLFGFVDEAHVIARPDGTLSLRSGACSGFWDMGVNRRRVDRLIQRAREDQTP